MARGWESKAVESQKEDAQNKSLLPRKRRKMTEQEKQKEREGIEMQRRRVVRELAATSSPMRRTALENALRFLDEQLSKP